MLRFRIAESSAIAHARRSVNTLVGGAGFNAADAGRAALIATEICSNMLKHAGGGELLVQRCDAASPLAVELIGIDQGPGMLDVARCLSDGFSTGGSPGTGLGAIERIADRFDLYSKPDLGTAVLAQLWPAGAAAPAATVGGFAIAKEGESECGDAWCYSPRVGGFLVLGVDGLGHGLGAAQAASAACRAFDEERHKSPAAIVERAHASLKPTRGAALAVLDVDFDAGRVTLASIGNLSAAVVTDAVTRRLASFNGIVGHSISRIRELHYPCTTASTVILHSDGLRNTWRIERYPGLLQHASALIAAVLYRDHRRDRDDALVVVVKRDAG